MNIEIWPLERIKPYLRNARRIPQSAVDKVAASIRAYGWQQPIVVDPDGVILAGHVRRLAAIQLKLTEAPVAIARGLTPEQARAYRLADNRSHDEAKWDDGILALELGELQGLSTDLFTAFDPRDLDRLLRRDPVDGEDDAPEPPEAPVTRRGDLWVLGEHRLLCGDATCAEDVDLATAGRPASMIWTDPPYGVSYVGKTREALTIDNDDWDGLRSLLDGFLGAAATRMEPSAPFYIAHPAGARSLVFGEAVQAAGWRIHQSLVWVKDCMVLGHSDYHYQHEPILYGFTPGGGRPGRGNHPGTRWQGDNSQTSIFQVARPKRSSEHPTMKPVELIAACIANSIGASRTVLDSFAGSGSTLIACEKLDAFARCIEIDPAYCEVIIRRWEKFTSKHATLTGEGATFEQVRERRLGTRAPENDPLEIAVSAP